MKISIAIVICMGIAFMFVSTASADLNDGLEAYYPFNGNADDESGNGNDGTVYGAALTADRYGNSDSAFLFNYGDRVDLPSNKDLFSATGFTWVLWVKLDEVTSNSQKFLCAADCIGCEDI